MPCNDDPDIDLAQITGLTDRDAATVRHLLSCDESFRAMYEDRALARRARDRLADQAGADAPRAACEEYEKLIAELEREIVTTLKKVR